MEPSTYTPEGVSRRSRGVILAVVIALAVIGYLVGLRAGVPEGTSGLVLAERSGAPASQPLEVLPAMSYAQVGAGGIRSADWRSADWRSAQSEQAPQPEQTWAGMTASLRAAPGDPVTDPQVRAQSLALRATRRAHNGAPPAIPHDTRGLDDRSCLTCHGQDLKIGGRVARSLPHLALKNCMQCHAAAAPAFLRGLGGVLAESTWIGIAAPSGGPRATPGAPPAIPHALQMRENCLVCHGPNGWPGMQTSHPERRNCLQCHALTQDRLPPGRTPGTPAFLPALDLKSR